MENGNVQLATVRDLIWRSSAQVEKFSTFPHLCPSKLAAEKDRRQTPASYTRIAQQTENDRAKKEGNLIQVMEITDDQIIERTLAGDTDAFSLLVRRWERPIYGLSLRMLGRDEDARDVCQETFLAAFRNLRKFRGDAKFSSWLYRIALNACHTKLRKNSGAAEQSIDQEDDEGRKFELADDGAEFMPDRLHRDQRAVAVRRALQALPAEMRQVIVMKEYEELTFAEIAEILNVPVSTVKSRLYTGLQQMRARLEKMRGAL